MTIPLQVTEFRHKERIEWDSLCECANSHHVSTDRIKELIYNGGSIDGHSTFDISMFCEMDLRKVGDKLVIFNTVKEGEKPVQIREARIVRKPYSQGSLCLPKGVTI